MKQLSIISILLIAAVSFIAFKPAGVKVGKSAPEFNLKSTNGSMVSLSDYSDKKGVILVFTCNHCPYAKLYEDRLIALDKKYSEKGWPVIAINPNDPEVQPADSYEKMIERAENKGFTFPYLFDEGQEVYPQYGATRTPHVYLLENTKKGFKVAYIGAIDDNAKDATAVKERFVENAIDALMAGNKVEKTETAAIGCTIKTKK
ncbi:MAG: thioredoxin family protein [Bacteroidia bacterium]